MVKRCKLYKPGRGTHLKVLVTPFGFGILWSPSEEFLGPEMAVAVVGLGLRIIPPLDQWMDGQWLMPLLWTTGQQRHQLEDKSQAGVTVRLNPLLFSVWDRGQLETLRGNEAGVCIQVGGVGACHTYELLFAVGVSDSDWSLQFQSPPTFNGDWCFSVGYV